MLTGVASCQIYGQDQQSQPERHAYGVESVPYAIARVKSGEFAAVHVDLIATANAVEAIPVLKEQFERVQNPLLKTKIAAALVRMKGDKDNAYWDFLVKQAMPVLESDAPDFKGYDSQGKAVSTKGTLQIDGGQWLRYQSSTLPTPSSPEYVSETSAESAVAARVLALFTGSDRFGYSMTAEKGSSRIEPGITPAQPVAQKWETFTEAADQAGLAGCYAGIHFTSADLAGRQLGRIAADHAWSKAKSHFNGNVAPSSAPSSRTALE